MKFLLAFLFILCGAAQAQTFIPADCAISYSSKLQQNQLQATVGAPYVAKSADLSWAMGVAFQVPSGPINGASVTLPTNASGYGVAGTTTAYLVIVPAYDSYNTCAGYGPGFTLTVKPRRDTELVSLASTVATPLQTTDVTFPLNAKALGILRGLAGKSVVFGISILIPRITIYPPGEDPKKVNQVGALTDFYRESACRGVSSQYCPTLNIN